MHSLSPYLIKCFNKNQINSNNRRYSILDAVGQNDTFILLEKFILENTDKFKLVEETKQVYKFKNFEFDNKNRLAFGWMESGIYGIKSEIIDVKTGNIDFKKTIKNAEIIKYFIYFYLPKGWDEGIVFMHAYRNTGIKTLFLDQFNEYFNVHTQLNLQMHPLAYEKALNNWLDAQAKEVRLLKFKGANDIGDLIKGLGHIEQELTLKSGRGRLFGKFKDFINSNSEQSKAIALLEPLCKVIKTVVELDGKTRTFQIGPTADHSICQIDVPETLIKEDGNPSFTKMQNWCHEIAIEFSEKIYPNIEVNL